MITSGPALRREGWGQAADLTRLAESGVARTPRPLVRHRPSRPRLDNPGGDRRGHSSEAAGRAGRSRDPLALHSGRVAPGAPARASVARHGGATQPCRKGIPQLVEAWAGAPELLEGFNLVVVGGDLDNPTPEERAVLSEIDAVCAPARRPPGTRPQGHRPHADVPQILRAAVYGIPGVAGTGGVYACPSRKEEFGLALLEALAAGLSCRRPRPRWPGDLHRGRPLGLPGPAPPTSGCCAERSRGEPPPPGSTRPARRVPARWCARVSPSMRWQTGSCRSTYM